MIFNCFKNILYYYLNYFLILCQVSFLFLHWGILFFLLPNNNPASPVKPRWFPQSLTVGPSQVTLPPAPSFLCVSSPAERECKTYGSKANNVQLGTKFFRLFSLATGLITICSPKLAMPPWLAVFVYIPSPARRRARRREPDNCLNFIFCRHKINCPY